MANVPEKLAALERALSQVRKGQRLAHGASIENAALTVNSGSGQVRAILGVQGDGTVGVQAVNGPPPPQPSTPIVASVLGGVTVSWDGQFAGGAVIPMDWQRVEVHASITPVYDPVPATLVTTIETAQGATVVHACDTPVYVRLLARNTSGAASPPSTTVGPFGPTPVVADDILDGIVTTLKLADDAVTAAKVATGAIDSDAIAAAAVTAGKIGANAVVLGKIASGAVNLNTLTGPLADTASQRYADLFRDTTAWAQLSASSGGTWAINTGATDTPSGGGKMVVTGDVQLASTALIPQDSDTLYRVMIRVRATAQDPSGISTIYMGVVGVAEDGVTLVNRAGANSNSTQHYCCTAGGSLPIVDGWKTYVGWIQGHSGAGVTAPAGPATDPRAPEVTHADVRYLRPMFWLNFGKATSAVMEVEAVTVEAIRTGVVGSTNLITGSVTAGAIATDAVTAGKIAADAVTAREITAGSVNTAELAAGAVTATEIAANAVTAGKIAASQVTATHLAANSVEAAAIAADAVSAGKIAADAVTAREIVALAVTSAELAANSVIAGKISAGAVTATALTVGIGESLAAKTVDAMGDATLWAQTADSGTPTWLTGVSDAAAGGTVAQAAGPVTLERTVNTPYDPDTMYRVTARVRTTVAPSAGTANVSMGLIGIAADGTTRVSSTGANAVVTGQHFIAANAVTVSVGTAWTTFTGYVQGTAATGTTVACPDPKAPGKLHTSVRYVRPAVRLLTGATGGTMQVDQVTVETLPTGVVNTVNISDGAITASKITAGAVDATALSATAITGKTITGGTVTGALIQTAASGQRITLNESSANKVLVYNSSGTAIGELSATGLLVKGTNGAILWLDPNDVFPNLRLTNAANTNSAVINVSGTAAVLGMNSGQFTAGAFTDMKWRTILGSALGTDFWCAERVRDSDTSVYLGGRIFLSGTSASIGFRNSADSTQDAVLTLQQGYSQLTKSRLEVYAPASSSAALYVNAETGQTGSLVRAQYNSVDKFKVDKDGNTTTAGNATVTGNLTVSGIGNRQPKYRTTNATKTSNTTLATDTQLTFTVDAGGVYVVEGLLLHSGPGDFKMGWTFPSGTDGTWHGLGNGVTVISGTSGGGTQQDTSSTWGYSVRTESTDLASPRTYGGISTNPYGVQVKATVRVGGTAGTFALQWAQGTSDATATTLYLDSYLILERIA
jgi:hypothetical protein